MRYILKLRVRSIEEKFEQTNWHKTASGEVECDTRSLGWFISFVGPYESLFLDAEKPDFQPGQQVRLILEGAEEEKT
jgi:hypothetical protein